MNRRQKVMDYIRILEHNRSVDEDVQDSGRSDKRHININHTTAELFAMMVTANALMDIHEALKEIQDEL